MKNIFSLTRVFIREYLFRNFDKNIVKKAIIYLLVYLYVCGMVVFISYGCIESLKMFGEEEIFIGAVMIVYVILIAIRMIFSSMNILYYSNDNEIILAYPVKGKEIVLAKLNTIIVSEYIFELMVFIPALVVYGISNNLTIYYYILMVCIGLLFPIIPTVIAALFVSVLMRTMKFIRNKDILQYFAIVIVFGFMIIMNLFMSDNVEDEVTNVQVAEALIKMKSTIAQRLEYMPNIKTYNSVLTSESNIASLATMTVISAILYYVIGCIISLYYAETLLRMSSSIKSKNKKIDFKSNSQLVAYFSKELKIWVRHPLFLMQCILPPIVFPIIFMIPANSSLKIGEDMASIIFISKEYMVGGGILRGNS